MKESIYKSYDELPIMLNAETLAKVLGIAPSSAYELMQSHGSGPGGHGKTPADEPRRGLQAAAQAQKGNAGPAPG